MPYLVTKKIYKNSVIKYQLIHGKNWLKPVMIYTLGATVIAYFLLPFYLQNTGAYLNWSVDAGLQNIGRLFIGTNALGIWDELFFIITVFTILRRYLSFWQANILQATLFTAFLFELGFIGWGPVMIFIFALAQGYIYRKTESLLVVIGIHLTFDLVLFLALIHAHHPQWMPIFVTG